MTPEDKRKRKELRGALLMSGGMAAMLLLPVAALGVVRAFSPRRTGDCWCGAGGNMRTYAAAQIMFKRNDWDGDGELEYAADYTLLHSQPDGSGVPINLIDSALANAKGWNGQPKHGYLFQEMKTIAGRPIDWKTDFAFCGTPYTYGVTGYQTFIVNTNGTVWGRDLGCADLLEDFPADPSAEGWVMAE